jgi:hypothetical protein
MRDIADDRQRTILNDGRSADRLKKNPSPGAQDTIELDGVGGCACLPEGLTGRFAS